MAKLRLAISMKTMATASITGESKKAKLASCEENPPSPSVENAVDHGVEPGHAGELNATMQAIVMTT